VTAYLIRRIGHGVLLLFGVSVLLFLMLGAAPGEFVTEARLNPQISQQTIEGLRAQYGLDRPLPVRYGKWLTSVAGGDLGYSFAYNMPVSRLLLPRARNTLLLTIPALFLAWLIAVPLGVFAAAARGRWLDRFFSAGTSALLGLPDVMIAILMLLVALYSRKFPVGGMLSPGSEQQGSGAQMLDILRHMVLPVCALVIGALAPIARQVRASVIEVLGTPHVRSALGHGLGEMTVLFRYALPAASNALISFFGFSVAGLLSVSLLVELVMGWPGMGPLLVEAILGRDVFVVMGAIVLSTLFLVAGTLLADVLLYASDPRIRVTS